MRWNDTPDKNIHAWNAGDLASQRNFVTRRKWWCISRIVLDTRIVRRIDVKFSMLQFY